MLLLGLLVSFFSVTIQTYPCYNQSVTTQSDLLAFSDSGGTEVLAGSCFVRVDLSDVDKKRECSGTLTVTQGVVESRGDSCAVEGDSTVSCYCSNYFGSSCNSLQSLFEFTSARVKETPCIRRRLFELFRPNSTDYEALLDKMNHDLDETEMAKSEAKPNAAVALMKYVRLGFLYTESNFTSKLGHQMSNLLVVYFFLYSMFVFFAICYFTYALAKKYYPFLRHKETV